VAGFDLDFNTIIGLWMAGAVVMVPLVAVSVRLALIPLLETLGRMRQEQSFRRRDEEVDKRFARLERRVADLHETMARRSF
jgi:hypothetical protein